MTHRPEIRPGLLLAPLLLVACSGSDTPVGDTAQCSKETTPIRAVQGDAYYSPFENREVTVAGIVTRVESGRGFYLEEPGNGSAGLASRAIFISSSTGSATTRPGMRVRVSGLVEENGERKDKLTTINAPDNVQQCGDGGELPLTQVSLPMDSKAREALEGMRVTFGSKLVITDNYSMYRGTVTLSSTGPQRMPTEDMAPGPEASEQSRSNRQHTVRARLPEPDIQPAPAGTAIKESTGILGHDGREQVLLLKAAVAAQPEIPPAPGPAHPGSIRAVSSNLLNFFNGDGQGGGFPTERGAETEAGFLEQVTRTHAVMSALQPDLLAVQELENDGFGPLSAAASLVNILGESVDSTFAVVQPATDQIGGDVITVGLFYREDRLEAVGPAHTLNSHEFRNLSRQPLAQVFRIRATGHKFLVAVNHLKSKGSCPETGPESDQDDGQGCWNPARTAAVNAQLPWLQKVAAAAATEHILIMGDMNAWRQEDPIRQLRQHGLVDVVESVKGLPQYSYRYFGQSGTLDYAFASPGLARLVRSASIWHINSDWPREMKLPAPWLRMSDHDPVVVDLDFTQASTSD